jgi:lysine 2,3-aminomutase
MRAKASPYHAGPTVGRKELLARFSGLDARIWAEADARFRVRVTRSWLGRMTRLGGPLARQALPDAAELQADPGDVPDPVGEAGLHPVPWVVQKHPDRALLLVTRRCHLYCRYCFRRDLEGPEAPTEAELAAAIAWCRGAGLEEVILSGGDPLALRDAQLLSIVDGLRSIDGPGHAVPTIRIHTRAPITAPDRVTPALAAALAARGPVWVIVHANHPDELSEDVDEGLAMLVDAGVPVLNQSVLLRGVNDDAGVLAALSQGLVRRRVFPYYLHHPDPVPGNAGFRISLAEGLQIHAELAHRVSGLALPQYVIDPPDGSGKVPVSAWVEAGGRDPVPSGTPQASP